MTTQQLWGGLIFVAVVGVFVIATTCPKQSGPGAALTGRQRVTVWVGCALTLLMVVLLSAVAVFYESDDKATTDASTIYFAWLGITVSLIHVVIAGQPRLHKMIANGAMIGIALLALWLGSRIEGFVTPVSMGAFVITIGAALFATWAQDAPGVPVTSKVRVDRRTCHLDAVPTQRSALRNRPRVDLL